MILAGFSSTITQTWTFLIQVFKCRCQRYFRSAESLKMHEVEFVQLSANIYRVRVLFLSKPLWDAFAVSKELVSRVAVVCGMIHLTLSERDAFVRMNHALISMDYTDQITIDYNKSPGKWQTPNVRSDESSN